LVASHTRQGESAQRGFSGVSPGTKRTEQSS